MEVKILEIRDIGTMIPVICINMNSTSAIQHWHLRRVGYPCDWNPNIAIAHLSADGTPFCNDPFQWRGSRTWHVAHDYIIKKWEELKDGDVVDVQFILGETSAPKTSERLGG